MIAAVRKKQRPLSYGLIVLLLCSWVSYVCQPCFAHTDTTGEHQTATVKMPCHPVQHQQDRRHHTSGGQPSDQHCNCHLYIAVAASDPDALLMAAFTQGFDLPPPLAYTTELQSWPVVINSRNIYPQPERAISPPFVKYTVLLN